MSDPYTIHYGPWSPDSSNEAVEFSRQMTATDVPTVDCLNVYYVDSNYRSLPGAALVAATPLTVAGAFTAIDASGNPQVFLGGATALYKLANNAFTALTGTPVSAAAYGWRFAQFGSALYGVTGSNSGTDGLQVSLLSDTSVSPAGVMTFTASITSNVMTVTNMLSGYPANSLQVGSVITAAAGVTAGTTILSLGSGTGGTGTYNLSTTPDKASATIGANVPPNGNVIATVGQFLMLGDIGVPFANTSITAGAFSLGTGDGSTRGFSGTLPNVPVRAKSVYVYVSANANKGGPDDGQGNLGNGNTITTGTVNYATGFISLNFAGPPANGAPITVSYVQAFDARVWWSAIALPAFFPAYLTNAALAFQSSYEDLEADLGPVMAIVGYPLYAVILQRTGITRATYQGGNTVFAFATYERKKGLVARGAYVVVGSNTYFLADDGFYVTDGANVNPIGTAPDNSAGIDNWFWANVNKSALSNISAAYDATMRSVLFAIPTGQNTNPDTLLIYNIIAQRWTKAAALQTVLIWSDSDGTRARTGIVAHTYTGSGLSLIITGTQYQLLTGAPAIGYMESCDIFFTDAQRRFTTAARAQVASTDQPQVIIGNRDSLQDVVQYANGAYPDRFSKLVPCLSSGVYTRVRVQSAAAQSIHGVTLFLETEGPM